MGLENTGRNRKPPRQNYRRRGKQHTYNGFPHYSTIYEPGHCICLDECCQSWDDGCVCLSCPCRRGIPHDAPRNLKEMESDNV